MVAIPMPNRSPQSHGISGRPRGHGAIRAAAGLLCLGLLLATHEAAADARLETHEFGNLDESRFVREYPVLDALLTEGHVIPGLHRNFVPQGIDFLDAHPGEVVLSGYFCERFSVWWQGFFRHCVLKRSALYLFDLESGQALRLALLERRDGQPMRLHAGGVAELHGRLWLPDNFVVFRFDPAELRNAEEPVITMRPENEEPIGVDSSGDFVTAHDGSLWIGNFQRAGRGHPLPAHYRSPRTGTLGWTAAYRIDPDTLRPVSRSRYEVSFGGVEFEVYRPDAALHHRNKAQGLSFVGDRGVVLSASFGARHGMLAFHRLPAMPVGDDAHGSPVTLPDGSVLRVQSLNLSTRQSVVPTPPGAEGVAYDTTTLAVAFEGGAMPYRKRWRLVEDRMLLLVPPPDFLDRD